MIEAGNATFCVVRALLHLEERAGAALFVADLGDHRQHVAVVALGCRLLVAHGDAVAHLGCVALAEDLLPHEDVQLAPGIHLASGRKRAVHAAIAGLLEHGGHFRQEDAVVGGLEENDLPILVLVAVADTGAGIGSEGCEEQSDDGNERLEHGNLRLVDADEKLIGLYIIALFTLLV